MGRIRRDACGTTIPLPGRLLAGRSAACTLRLTASLASSEHATITWTGDFWELRDLASRNGTFVNKRRIDPGEAVRLRRAATIAFGDADDGWTLVDASQPGLVAVDLETGALLGADGGLLVLPSVDAPEVCVFRDAAGDWVLERDEEQLAIDEPEIVVRTSAAAYRLLVPVESEGTPMAEPGPHLANIALEFAVSRDEEHVDITVVTSGRRISLEAREHGYLLVTLARARAEDAARGLPLEERGWIDRDQLLDMLAVDVNALNVAIFRARQQLLEAGIDGAQGIVEVRRGKRRLGLDRFEVLRA